MSEEGGDEGKKPRPVPELIPAEEDDPGPWGVPPERAVETKGGWL